MFNRLIFLVFFVLSSCCCTKEKIITVPMEENIYLATKQISSIILHYADDLRHDMNLHLRDAFAHQENGDMLIWLDFTSQEIVDVDEARRIMVHTVEGLIQKLNRGFAFGECVSNFPFTYQDLYISIEYESYFVKYVDPLYVARCVLSDGHVVCSYAGDAFDRNSVIFHQHCEPYETSANITDIEDQISHDKPKALLPTGSKDDGFYYPSEKRRYK